MAEESFDKQWSKFLKEQGSFEKAGKYSYTLWKDKYQGGGSKKYGKPQEIFTEKVLIPGKIYTCLYAGMDELKSGSQFIDHWPVLFSMGQIVNNDQVYETCIDFNLIPPKVRPFVIEKLHKYFISVIDNNASQILIGKKGKKSVNINFKLAQAILAGTGFERAYITLHRDKMGKIKVYDYADWVSVVPLYTGGIRGKGVNKIYQDYVKNMGQMPKEKEAFINKLKK